MSSSASPVPEQQAPAIPVAELERVVSPTPSAKKRFSALQRIKKLGGKFKPKSKKAVTAIPKETLAPVLEAQEELAVEEDATVGQLDIADPPEPATLAERIRTLISSLPAPSPQRPPIKTDPPPVDADGCPIPPAGAVRIKDPKLIELLSDPDIMAGSPDDNRLSVWSALDALPAPAPKKPTMTDALLSSSDDEPGDDVQIKGDVMVYCPLHPTAESKVELAHTRVVEVPVGKLDGLGQQSRWDFLWSVTVGLVKSPPPQTKLVQIWVPSTTKISFHALWWGYRMYLPPPVMASLNEDETEAEKIVGTITAALSWFLGHTDVTSIPPALQPAFLLLQKLAPYAGYIATFVAWIWGTVKNTDKGNGVVLTATWLLPVALIPSAIKASDAPGTTPPTPAAATSTA
ncbi:hypothetical protein C8F04DRAFT_36997 [Mycena alexandri]|uniref:Uncharacterized protein n=1 Tax=Mycena alexandri TaxID=1745969 RepID=A0AAD6TDG5_9AGAR|nr:hypothetical protein C8F04DRAFT_36997 [Mycena alexandri]